MTVIGLDDTDSRDRGMCTTYVAARIANRLREEASVERLLLVRLNPAVPHKTRGNAALALHTAAPPDRAFDVASDEIETGAEIEDTDTHPGLVVASDDPRAAPESVTRFARQAVTDLHTLEDTLEVIESAGYRSAGWKVGRGQIGALAAIGAFAAFDDWTYEAIAYREPDRWGTPRRVESTSVFSAAEATYPKTWDTVDLVEDETVCVPHTPGPVLFGVRGDDADAVASVADAIEGERIHHSELFVTNQGTDIHLREATASSLDDGRSYRISGTVSSSPETREGGHVFFSLRREEGEVACAAFEPTKRFRDHVRGLRVGDRITACGEVSRGTLKLEKFAVRSLVRTEFVTPSCPDCDRGMESAGRDQGYRCRKCDTHRSKKDKQPLERDLERGWYEVPPCARRHIAKPLVRGGFDAAVHPER